MPTTQTAKALRPRIGSASLIRSVADRVNRDARRLDPIEDFAQAVVDGLARTPRELPSRFLYDEPGSRLYDQITRLPEYYPARTEAAILAKQAGRIRAMTGPAQLLEFGSGTSVKTEHLLGAFDRPGRRQVYIPVDVSPSALQSAVQRIAWRHPEVEVLPIHATYQEAFPLLRAASPVLGVFLGSTIGNMDPDTAFEFWSGVAEAMAPGDHFLLGVDLDKDPGILIPAYADSAGVSARFTRNLFARMNRELGAHIDLGAIAHEARYDSGRHQIEIRARFTSEQEIEIAPFDRVFSIAAGERILTEVSRKYQLAELLPRLAAFGLEAREVLTDERGWFASILLQRS
jgi:L-histidine N-alpha-methyltransferase